MRVGSAVSEIWGAARRWVRSKMPLHLNTNTPVRASDTIFAEWVRCVFEAYAFPGCGYCGIAFGSARDAVDHAPAHLDVGFGWMDELIVEAENSR